MKIIFLDIDGVLNTHFDYDRYGFSYIDNGLVEILKAIVYATESKIVLSSTWRVAEEDKKIVRSHLRYNLLDFIDCTPVLTRLPRAEEIKLWLKEHPEVQKFAILDDSDNAGIGLEDNFFQTNPYVGLTNEIAQKIINYFNKDSL
jgi:hypothetical protein